MVTGTESIITQDIRDAEIERAVTEIEQVVRDLVRRAEIYAEASERPRWCDYAVWLSAVDEAALIGYTGHDRYARAAELLNERYGY